ncbi:hypothetical protein [Streptomyces diastaticus]
MIEYRALTVRQPWAGAIAHQNKRVENRSWKLPAKHHGTRLLIHAAAQPDRDAFVYGPNLDVYSAIVAVATVKESHWTSDGTCCGPWGFENTHHWVLSDVTALSEPIQGVKGRLGIWTPDTSLVNAVDAQLLLRTTTERAAA